jgi:non-specific serine/threonine protein kinase
LANGCGEIEAVARLAVALVPFWEVQGSLREGRHWLDTVLAATDRLPAELLTNVLVATGELAFWQVDLGTAAARFEESLALARTLGDRSAIATAVTWLGAARGAQGAFAEAERLLAEGITLHEALQNDSGSAWALFNWGRALGNRGAANTHHPDYLGAVPPLERSLARYCALGDVRFSAITATHLGAVLVRIEQHERAVPLLREGLTGLRAVGDHAYLFPSLLTLAAVAAWTNQPVRAARLLGGVEAVALALGTTLAPVNRITQAEALRVIQPRLAPAALDAALNAGRAMSLDEVMAEAWAFAHDAAPAP